MRGKLWMQGIAFEYVIVSTAKERIVAPFA